MTRKEEIEQASILHSEIVRNNSNIDEDFIAGAEWADEHPRNDVIGVDSITYIRNILVSKFYNIAKKNPGKIYNEVPEMKKAFEMTNMFDKACEFAGYKFNEEKGVYEIL